MGLDGLVGVRGEGGRGESEGAGDMRFDSLVPAFSSTLWAMDSQPEERSVLTVCCERAEGGREIVCETPRIEGGLGTWPPLSSSPFAKSTGFSQQRVASVSALDGFCWCEKVRVCVSAGGEGSELELERRRRPRSRLMRPPRRRASMAAAAKETGGTGVVRSDFDVDGNVENTDHLL